MTAFSFSRDSAKPRNVFSLNGTWSIAGGSSVQPANFPSTIVLPSVVDTAEPQYDWLHAQFHWYRTTFTLANISSEQNIFLKIAQSMFGTEVWLNGNHLGGSISCYTSHEYLLNKFLNSTENELVIRVGSKNTLPPESAVGRDQEKEIYTPGIWGDVELICVGKARIKLVQIIPHCETKIAEVRAWMENLTDEKHSFSVSTEIVEKASQEKSSTAVHSSIELEAHSTGQIIFHLPIERMRLWSPENPFLYEAHLFVQERKMFLDALPVVFGMREFKVLGADFYLNGKKILLRGGNIAFHRFLSDKQRKLLPWNEEWIKKILIDIPKAHHFNFFRNHLGQMYNRWYDIADENGMLLQNEWQFWGATGSNEQIRKEFTAWLQDNWNHPSIIIWDPLNESSDQTIQHEIVPEMKKLDPTRPWESVDFLEEHPYIFSLGMVLNDRKFGFARSLQEIEHLPVPSMVNEFLWWWCNDAWEPTVLTKEIVERWLGRAYSQEELMTHQSFLAQELIELFRRMRIKAIQPFVYLSNNDGPTAHWFLGDIKDLQPKPLLRTLRNAFAPFGVSLEVWDRHFFTQENRSLRIFIFNDSHSPKEGVVTFGIKNSDNVWLTKKEFHVTLFPVSDVVRTQQFTFPSEAGTYFLCAEIFELGRVVSYSKKIAYTFHPPKPEMSNEIILFDPTKEISSFLAQQQMKTLSFFEQWSSAKIMFLNGRVFTDVQYQSKKNDVEQFVKNGGTLIINEPEFRVMGTAQDEIIPGVSLKISQRADVDKGGYDSYVFAEEPLHPLWKGIEKVHLQFFNGAYGGEIVSQYDVEFSLPAQRLASCGLHLQVNAVSELHYGKGKIILSRIQIRGRLCSSDSSYQELYARRPDPVAQQYLFNLLSL